METYTAGRNLLTPHGVDAYPGVRVVHPGPEWTVSIIVAHEGQTILALGGEEVYAYETVDGARAQGFSLRRGDRATLVRSELPHQFAEWRIDRAPGSGGE